MSLCILIVWWNQRNAIWIWIGEDLRVEIVQCFSLSQVLTINNTGLVSQDYLKLCLWNWGIIFTKCCNWHVCEGWGQGGGGVGYTHKHVIHDFKYYEQMPTMLSQINCMLSFCNCSNHTTVTVRSMMDPLLDCFFKLFMSFTKFNQANTSSQCQTNVLILILALSKLTSHSTQA